MDAAPIDVVREIYRRFIFDESPFELMSEDIVFEIPMLDQQNGFHGHYGVADFFRRWLGTWDNYRIDLEKAVETPDGRIATFFTERAQGKGSGVEVQMRPMGIWTVQNGLATHYKGYLDRDEGCRDAGIPG